MTPSRYRIRIWATKLGILRPWKHRQPLGRRCGCIIEWDPNLNSFVVLIGCENHWYGELWAWEDI